jgi:hypothetical protein
MRFWPALALAFAIFSYALPPANAQIRVAQEIGGSYRVDGTNPDGSQYTGVVTIQREGNGYRFNWLIQDGSTFTGMGLSSGNRITVYWGQSDPVIYQIGNDAVLRGTWGPGGNGRETLTPN